MKRLEVFKCTLIAIYAHMFNNIAFYLLLDVGKGFFFIVQNTKH